MTRRITIALVLVLLAAALGGASGAGAATKAKTLGPAPQNFDCLAWNNPERGCYYGIIGGIDYSISPHIARVGEKLVGTSSGSGNDPWSWYHPPGVKVDECNPPTGGGPGSHAGTCVYTATSSTGGWRPGPEAGGRTAASSVFFGSAIHCCTIGTYIAGDYVAILGPDEYSVDGFVRDADGDPVKDGGNIFVAGESSSGKAVDSFIEVDDTGYYNGQFEKGEYTVSGFSGGDALCVDEVKSQCIEHKKVSPSSTINFRRDGFAEVAGTITNLANEPVKNVAILITDTETGKPAGDGETDREGKYQVDLDESGTYRVVPVKGESVFNPDHRIVGAETGKEVMADFKLYDPLKVEIESGTVREPDNDFLTRITLTNRSSDLTITEIAPVNEFAVRVAQNAYPADRAGSVTAKQLIPIGGPQPTELAPGQSWSADLRLTADTPGFVGLRTKFTGKAVINGDPQQVADSHDATVEIEDPKSVDASIKNALAAQALDMFVERTAAKFQKLWAEEAKQDYKDLKKKLGPADEKRWFGANGQLKISKVERGAALAMGIPAEVAAIAMPKGNGKDLTAVDNYALYRGARAEADREAGIDYFDSRFAKPAAAVYAAGTSEISRILTEGPSEAVAQHTAAITNYYESHIGDVQINSQAAIKALVADSNDVKRALSETQTALGQAIPGAVTLMEKGIEDLEGERNRFNNEAADLIAEGRDQAAAVKFARRDSAIREAGSTAIADELVFGGATAATIKVGGKVIKGGQASLQKISEMVGTARKGGPATIAKATQLGEKSLAGLPTYFNELSEEARTAIGMDQMRGIGGISGKDASIIRRNVAEVNRLAREKFGAEVAGELYVRPVNPFEVVGAMAKVEVVGVKSINPIDELLGASPKGFGQPGIFPPKVPETLPNWHNYTKAEQIEIKERYQIRTQEYTERHGYADPKGKMYKMKKAINDKVDITVHGQTPDQDRTYELALHAEKVGDTEILSYKHLSINGETIVSGKPRPIGVDLDDVMWTDKNGGRLDPDVEDFFDENMDVLNRQAAIKEGFSEPFHGQTLRRRPKSDVPIEKFPEFAHYGLRHLNEAEARKVAQEIADEYNRAFPDRTPLTPDKVLEEVKGRFGRKLIKVTEDDVIYQAGITFVDPQR